MTVGVWEEVRQRVLAQPRSGQTVETLVARLRDAGVDGLLPVRSLCHLVTVANLTADFMDYVERLGNGSGKTHVAGMLLCLRESGRTLFRTLDDMSMGLEQLVSALEDQLLPELQNQPDRDDEGVEDSAEREALQASTEALQAGLANRLASEGFPHGQTQPLARCMAESYAECVQFHRELERLGTVPAADLEAVMSVLLDLQYSVDVQLRRLLNDDVATDGGHAFSVGLLNRVASFLSQLEMPAHVKVQRPLAARP